QMRFLAVILFSVVLGTTISDDTVTHNVDEEMVGSDISTRVGEDGYSQGTPLPVLDIVPGNGTIRMCSCQEASVCRNESIN
ncbi:hypothetical protein PFISCL1PPCAC_16459, partial [Pristionchus fissidentatus]